MAVENRGEPGGGGVKAADKSAGVRAPVACSCADFYAAFMPVPGLSPRFSMNGRALWYSPHYESGAATRSRRGQTIAEGRLMSTRTRLLVIDDEPAIRRFLRVGLGSQDYDVIEATTGSEGLLYLKAEKPGLVLLDLG